MRRHKQYMNIYFAMKQVSGADEIVLLIIRVQCSSGHTTKGITVSELPVQSDVNIYNIALDQSRVARFQVTLNAKGLVLVV